MPAKIDPTSQNSLDTSTTNSESLINVGPFASLRIQNFRPLAIGTTLSYTAQWIQQVTLSWLVYNLTGSGTMLGTINLVRSVASVSMIPTAGILIDRINRRKLMLLTNGWLFLITVVLGLLLIFGYTHISFLLIFAFLGGLAQTIDMTIRQVVVFDIVPRRVTPNAMAIIQTGWGLTRSLGPALGGFLILWLGPGGNFLIQAGAYALIAITIVQIQLPARKSKEVRGAVLQDIWEGIQYVIKAPITRTFTIMGFILPFFIIPIFSVLTPVYAKDVFSGGPDVLGFLMAAVGIGGIAGGIVTASLRRIDRRGLLQIISLFMLSVSLMSFAFTTTLVYALLLLALSGFFEMIFLTSNQTLLQLSIPDKMRGRVTSLVNLNAVLSPLGGLIAGVGTDLMGGPKWITVILCGIAACVAVGIFLFSSTIRNYRLSRATMNVD
jgi:MFS family permease